MRSIAVLEVIKDFTSLNLVIARTAQKAIFRLTRKGIRNKKTQII